MSDFLLNLVFLIQIGSAIYFIAITGKLFDVKKRFIPILLLISPSVASFASLCFDAFFLNSGSGMEAVIKGVCANTFILFALQIIFLLIYVKIVKAKNPSIAVFIYLCSTMLVPGMMLVYDTTSSMAGLIPELAYICLHVLFYRMVVKPLEGLTKERQVTNVKLFMLMPTLAFIFNTLMYALFEFTASVVDFSGLNVNGMKEFLESDPVGATVREVIRILRDTLKAQATAYVYPSLFTLLVLILAVSIIVKNLGYMNETIKAHSEVKALAVEVMEALAHTIDAKDEYTRGHSVRVAKYSKMIAEKMGMSESECEDVYYMGLLHDIGKIGVPNEIINKPARLTDEEYGVVKKHPMTGFEILAEIKTRPDLSTGARWHHEKMDGTGYPDHKKGEEIPIQARIIAVADSYDAMTSNRSYRSYLPQDVVREEILNNIGTQFDKECAMAMIRIMDEDTEYVLHE